jgi:hypothetical protein
MLSGDGSVRVEVCTVRWAEDQKQILQAIFPLGYNFNQLRKPHKKSEELLDSDHTTQTSAVWREKKKRLRSSAVGYNIHNCNTITRDPAPEDR